MDSCPESRSEKFKINPCEISNSTDLSLSEPESSKKLSYCVVINRLLEAQKLLCIWTCFSEVKPILSVALHYGIQLINALVTIKERFRQHSEADSESVQTPPNPEWDRGVNKFLIGLTDFSILLT